LPARSIATRANRASDRAAGTTGTTGTGGQRPLQLPLASRDLQLCLTTYSALLIASGSCNGRLAAGAGGAGGCRRHDHWHGCAVAIDRAGNLAAATSTGGMTNKRYGRVGDSPIIGAGTYANNETCAVSATGSGEFFIVRGSRTTSIRWFSTNSFLSKPRPGKLCREA